MYWKPGSAPSNLFALRPTLPTSAQKAGTGGVVERVQEAAASATQTAKEYVQASLGSCPANALLLPVMSVSAIDTGGITRKAGLQVLPAGQLVGELA